MADEEDTLLKSMIDDIKGVKPSEEKAETTEEETEEVVEEQEEENDEGENDAKGDKAKTKDEGTEVEDDNSEEDVQPTRGQTRQQRLANQLKQEREERVRDRKERDELIADRARKEAELEHYRKQQSDNQSASQRKAEEERLALLDPTERAVYEANTRAKNLEHRLNQLEFQRIQDQDRDRFHAKAAVDPTYGKYADQVEEMYQEGLKRHVSAPREELHSLILGRELKKDMAKKASGKKEAAKKRIDTVTSKSATARGDVTGSKSGKTVEERLAGVLI